MAACTGWAAGGMAKMPERALLALADQRRRRPHTASGRQQAEHELAQFARERIDVHVLANQLQEEGAKSFVKSWNDLMSVIDSKTAVLDRAS
jgi:transaldolase